MVNKHRCFMIL